MADDGFAAVKIDGVRDLVRAIGKVEPELRKEIGQANKRIGQRVIDKAFPKARPETIGRGAGAIPRASAATTSLRIMAGGAHRDGETRPFQQWGKRRTRPVKGGRPYLRRSAELDMPQIEKDYLGALHDAARRVGIETEVGSR